MEGQMWLGRFGRPLHFLRNSFPSCARVWPSVVEPWLWCHCHFRSRSCFCSHLSAVAMQQSAGPLPASAPLLPAVLCDTHIISTVIPVKGWDQGGRQAAERERERGRNRGKGERKREMKKQTKGWGEKEIKKQGRGEKERGTKKQREGMRVTVRGMRKEGRGEKERMQREQK